MREHLKSYFNQITVQTLFGSWFKQTVDTNIWYNWEILKMDLVLDIKESFLILLGMIMTWRLCQKKDP